MKAYDSLRATLDSENITSLDDMLHQVAKSDRITKGNALLLAAERHESAPPHDEDSPPPAIIHRIPGVPLMLDGTQLDNPEAILKYNGQPLYYTPTRTATGIGLAAYTSRARMYAELKNLLENPLGIQIRSASNRICQQPPTNLPEHVCFFEHINEGGNMLCLPPARAYRNLTRVGRNKVLWWYMNDWNDVISSLSWCRWDVTLYEHVNYGGSQLWLPAGCTMPNLVPLGWNDRASAIVNWGRRF